MLPFDFFTLLVFIRCILRDLKHFLMVKMGRLINVKSDENLDKYKIAPKKNLEAIS